MLPPPQLLEALREEPASDDLQGIYADWLEDQQSPQARLVRLGIELARLVRDAPAVGRPGYDDYRVRYQALDNQFLEYRIRHQAAWLGPLAGLGGGYEYTGGVLTHVVLPLAAFCEHGPELLRWHPIRSVRLTDVGDRLGLLRGAEALRDLRKLSFRGQVLGSAGATELAQCPQFERLLHLDLYNNRVETPGLRDLAASPYLPRLQELVLAHNPLDDDAGVVLAEAPYWPALAALDVYQAGIGLPGMLALARSPLRRGLRAVKCWIPGQDAGLPEVRQLRERFGRIC